MRTAFEALVRDVMSGVHVSKISARFHNGLARVVHAAVIKTSLDTQIRSVVLSGGVWQKYHPITPYFIAFTERWFQSIHSSRGSNERRWAFRWDKPQAQRQD